MQTNARRILIARHLNFTDDQQIYEKQKTVIDYLNTECSNKIFWHTTSEKATVAKVLHGIIRESALLQQLSAVLLDVSSADSLEGLSRSN